MNTLSQTTELNPWSFRSLKNKLDAFLQSGGFVFFVVACACVSWIFEIEYAFLCLLGIIGAYILFTQRSMKPFMPMIAFLSTGFSGKDTITKTHLVFFILIGIIVLLGLVYLIIKKIKIKEKFVVGDFLVGMFMGLMAVCFGGIGYEHYDSSQLLKLLAISFSFILIYEFCLNFIYEDVRGYIAKIFLGLAIICLIQMTIWYARCDDIIMAFNNKSLKLGWANINDIAVIFVLSAILMIYKACKHKIYTTFYIMMAMMCGLGLFFTFCRGAILTAVIFIPIAWIYGYIKAYNRSKFLWTSVIFIVLFLVIISFVSTNVDGVADYYFMMGTSDNGRVELYEMALRLFREHPLFGVGIYGDSDYVVYNATYWRIHNTPLQILACTGVIGVILFVYYFAKQCKIEMTYFSRYKFFAMITTFAFYFRSLTEIDFLKWQVNMMIIFLVYVCESETRYKKKLLAENR